MELTAQRIENGADQQGAEQPLRHSAQCVNTIPLGGKDDVFPLEKRLYFFHKTHAFLF